jgi:hypothetical protein
MASTALKNWREERTKHLDDCSTPISSWEGRFLVGAGEPRPSTMRADPASRGRVHVRIGLGAGESTVKDGDYFGMPTVEAARLCAQAPADGILISTLVKTLAGRCEGIEFRSAGMLEFGGLPVAPPEQPRAWACGETPA